MRLIVRKERPHPGAQLRFTDADGLRLTVFATPVALEVLACLVERPLPEILRARVLHPAQSLFQLTFTVFQLLLQIPQLSQVGREIRHASPYCSIGVFLLVRIYWPGFFCWFSRAATVSR
ncbi:hypothetical protein [Streptomyces platensis]|uniref:hypothetical protein n=1 Tax=Streptomyces platensis TaxID=58346 RepID=UPI002E274DE6